MQALIVVDAQNEFSPQGRRPVPNHAAALAAILSHVEQARREGRPIGWVRHHNKPHESPAFVPGTWGAEFSPGLGPRDGFGHEVLFVKEVYGAFTGTGLDEWLREVGANELLVVGFYAHMCVATTAREALTRGFEGAIDPEAPGARALDHDELGRQSAAEVVSTAFLHLTNMGARVLARAVHTTSSAAHA